MSVEFEKQDRMQLTLAVGRLIASVRSPHHDARDRVAVRNSVSDLVEKMEARYGPEPVLMAMRGKFIGNHLVASHVDRKYLGRYDHPKAELDATAPQISTGLQ